MTRIDPDFDRMTEAEYADWLYANRDSLESEEPEQPITVSPGVSAVISVRVPGAELRQIEEAAKQAGLPLSTFVREAALATSQSVNLTKARRDLEVLRRAAAALAQDLGAA